MSSQDNQGGQAQALPDEPSKSRSPFSARTFVSRNKIRNGAFEGKKGYFITVQLTSYRSLPLSCVAKIELKVDGKAIDPADITFVLNGFGKKLTELAALSHIFWWILDPAELFVMDEHGLSEGVHVVQGTLVTVEPYITAGRGSFESYSEERLPVEAA